MPNPANVRIDMTAPDLDALVARLKDDAVPSGGRWQVRQDAAAAIVALRDEVARLELWGKATFEAGFQATQRAERAEAEVARLKQWQVDMVAKAADKSLDGYRELGAHCAAAETASDALQLSLRNCLLLAMRRAHAGDEGWKHIIRFCSEAGVVPSPLRSDG